MRTKGKIATWNEDKGYGFIAPLTGGKQVFIHVKALSNRNRHPQVNEVVSYSLSTDKQGRPCAVNVTLAGDKLTEKTAMKSSKTALAFASLFLAGIGISAATGSLPAGYLVGYTALSLITFLAYALDKSAAQQGAWRTSEGALLMLGLAGGWPGALIAQETLRHKSKKTSFRATFWVTVSVNCAALAWMNSSSGRAALQDFWT